MRPIFSALRICAVAAIAALAPVAALAHETGDGHAHPHPPVAGEVGALGVILVVAMIAGWLIMKRRDGE